MCPFHLHADELGVIVLTVLRQPVGVSEARRVLVDVRDDVIEETSGHPAAHGKPSRTGTRRAATSATTAARSFGTSCSHDALAKSNQRADDSFMLHQEEGPNSVRASSVVRPRSAM